jgi:ComF family protein
MGPLDGLLGLLVPPRCWACGRGAPPRAALCRGCRGDLRWLDGEPVVLAGVETWAPLAYEGPARAVVRGIKFDGAVGLAAAMAAQIVANAPPSLLHPSAALVPVPIHPRRARARGYNQAERLAAAVGHRSGLRVDDCLRRRGAATRQVGRGRGERLAGIAGAIELRPGPSPRGRLVLVDDVATTGATLAACATALRGAGAERVAAIAYARTPGR